MFLPSVNRDLGFYKNEASLGPFRSAKTVHNRKFLPFFAKPGHGLGRVGPFGFVVEGLSGGAVEMNAKELVRQACDGPIGRRCESSHVTVHTENACGKARPRKCDGNGSENNRSVWT